MDAQYENQISGFTMYNNILSCSLVIVSLNIIITVVFYLLNLLQFVALLVAVVNTVAIRIILTAVAACESNAKAKCKAECNGGKNVDEDRSNVAAESNSIECLGCLPLFS